MATLQLHDHDLRIYGLPPWSECKTPMPSKHQRGGDDHSQPSPHPGLGASGEVKAGHLLTNIKIYHSNDRSEPELPGLFETAAPTRLSGKPRVLSNSSYAQYTFLTSLTSRGSFMMNLTIS